MSFALSTNYAGMSTYAIDMLSCRQSGRTATSFVSDGGDRGQGQDTVELSTGGRLAASGLLDSLILPTEENVRTLSTQLGKDLAQLLGDAGISTEPPIAFSTSYSGDIVIEGDRADKEQILKVVNADERVSQEIRNTVAISSHAVATAESLEFQREYVTSDNPETVVAKYSYLFTGQRSHHTSVVFDGNGIDVLSDGKEWLSYQA